MDLTQLSQMVSWLDEEHRRDREELARLDQRLQNMAIEKQEQSRRIQDLESRLASTQAQLTRFTQIEQALQQLKGEVVVLLDKQTEARLNAERDAERARVTDREALGRGIAEVRKELTRPRPDRGRARDAPGGGSAAGRDGPGAARGGQQRHQGPRRAHPQPCPT